MTCTGMISYSPVAWIGAATDAAAVSHRLHDLYCEAAAIFEQGDFPAALGRFVEICQTQQDTPGVRYAIAVCCARLARPQEAVAMLDAELMQPRPHPGAYRLRQDLAAMMAKTDGSAPLSTSGKGGTISFFAMPKPFKGLIGTIQRNAIRSWLGLSERPEIILLGSEDGVAETAREFGLRHLPQVACNEFGTPLVDAMFHLAQQEATGTLLVYLNADIILGDDFTAALRLAEQQQAFLMIGRRWDSYVWEELDLENPVIRKTLQCSVREAGLLHGASGIDYFAFRKGLYDRIPPFAIGRTAWDNWLVWYAGQRRAVVIDATRATMVIHQDHDYNHTAGGAAGAWTGSEAQRNQQLAGSGIRTIADADYAIEEGRLLPANIASPITDPTPLEQARLKLSQAKDAYAHGLYKEALGLLEHMEINFNVQLPGVEQLRAACTHAIAGASSAPPVTRPVLLQVNTFYDAYLEDLYRQHPQLKGLPFQQQRDAVMSDGFAAIHNFVPGLCGAGYDAQFIIANCPQLQATWLQEHNLEIQPDQNWIHDVLRLQIEQYRPDVLLLSDSYLFDSSFLRSLSYRPSVILGWAGEYIPETVDWSGFDAILSNFYYSLMRAYRYGARATERFAPGFTAWLADETVGQEPIFDVVFVGQWTSLHHHRNNLISALAREAYHNKTFSLGLYISGDPRIMPPEVTALNRGGVFGLAMHRALKGGRIAMNFGLGKEFQEAGNMRIFEVIGSGVFLLHEYMPNIREYFEPGYELETFGDEREMLDKIRYYLAFPDKRQAIARRGQQRCMQDHAMELRITQLDAIIQKYRAQSRSRQLKGQFA
ncbi:glycosyltransferase [Trichlorobacter lovleyi]|uniref:glycosyltransferase n=1 Tax=Trichlorobacter lovleyi TaxID=313985 RepID=UPI0023F3E904|nr:glycosyltransferase [Trichlorobacter lovleyi]